MLRLFTHSRVTAFLEGGVLAWVLTTDIEYWVRLIAGIVAIARVYQSIRLDRAREKAVNCRLKDKNQQ